MKGLLERACKERFAVEIIYIDKENKFSKRRILVKAINEKFIRAYCLTRKQARIFKINTILAVDVIRKTASRETA